jgi:hypothetical protein
MRLLEPNEAEMFEDIALAAYEVELPEVLVGHN